MELKVGTVVVIEKKFTDDESKYRSKVIDSGEDFIMIDYPTHLKTGKTAYFMDGTELVVTFADELKMFYAFRSEVRGRLVRGVPMLKLAYEGGKGLIKVQRREFVRVETAIDVAAEIDGRVLQLVSEDISAGGIALDISGSAGLSEDAVIQLLIVLPFTERETKYVRTQGKVIRIHERGSKKVASFMFLDISAPDRQQIVQFCFERQLHMKNK